jgi:predicted transcriptional regulator
MKNLKDLAIATLRKMPAESSLEEIMYEINFVCQVMEGLDDADSCNLITTNELLERVDRWNKPGRKK